MKIDASTISIEAKREFMSSEETRFTGFAKVSPEESFKNSLAQFMDQGRNNVFNETFSNFLTNGPESQIETGELPLVNKDKGCYTESRLKRQFNFFNAINQLILQRLGGSWRIRGESESEESEPVSGRNSETDVSSEENALEGVEYAPSLSFQQFRPMLAMTFESSYYEKEKTSFSAQGCVKTADGKSIDFGLDLQMERELKEQVEMSIMMDPLVINYSGSHTELMSEFFEFDLNADGTAEQIPGLASDSGFLAYDKDESGVIENGSELFGGITGKGFAELQAHDDDKNGWIDENDSIYEKLSLWAKDENGEDVLFSLKDKNIGAISLDDAETEFSLINDKERLGVIKNTSVALTEDYKPITVQQLDLRVKDIEQNAA
ncbi:MAG: hypothetical protein ACYTFY_17120 [Planctomycetota bacterium]|jgi:hypothetical protein